MTGTRRILDDLFVPLIHGDSDRTRVAKPIRAILLTLIGAAMAILLIGVVIHSRRITVLAAVTLAGLAGIFILLRHEYFKTSAFLTCLFAIGLSGYSLATGDGIHDVAIILFPGVLVVASMLLGRNVFLLFSLLSVVLLGAIGACEMLGFLTTRMSHFSRIDDVLTSMVLLSALVVLIWLLTDGLVRALRGMQRSEESYRAIFNATSEAILIHDPATGAILDVNNTVLDMFGYSKDELSALSIADLSWGAPTYDKDAAFERFQRARKEGPQLFAWRSKRKDGTLFWTEVALRMATLGGEERILAVARDVDEKRRIEEKLRQSERIQVMGQLAGGIAHDFNNQLGGIIGFAELIARSPNSENRRNYCKHILTAAESAARLNKKLLGFARTEQGDWLTVNINDVINETILVLDHSVGKNIEILSRLASEELPVLGESAELQNALLNLGINSRDAMPDGGTIEFETEQLFLDDKFLSRYHETIPAGNYVTISVTDSGHGIPESVQERMFEPFFTTKEVGKGTGMGLSGVYATVKAHRGLITCYSEEHRGTVFKLYLPLHDGTPSTMPEEDENLDPFRGSETVLIVDDEPVMLNLAEQILSELGYKIRSFDSPLAAIVYYQNHVEEIDLVVLDMVMPKIDGYKTFEKLKSANPKVKGIVCSGYASQVNIEGVKSLGISGFVDKPYRKKQLAQAVYRAIHD